MIILYSIVAIFSLFISIILIYRLFVSFIFTSIFLYILFFSSGFFLVKEGEQVVITQFGEVMGEYKEPGAYLKVPFLWKANYFDKRLHSDIELSASIPTNDGYFLEIDSTYFWVISDPTTFMTTSEGLLKTNIMIKNLISGSVRENVSMHNLVEIVRISDLEEKKKNWDFPEASSERKVLGLTHEIKFGRVKLEEKMTEDLKPYLENFGIELRHIFIQRIKYDKHVEKMIHNRMIEEQLRYAAKIRSEGRRELKRIRGKKLEAFIELIAPAKKEALIIEGEALAKEIDLKTEEYEQDLEFYNFWKTLKSYDNSLSKKSNNLLLSTDSRFLHMIDRENIEDKTKLNSEFIEKKTYNYKQKIMEKLQIKDRNKKNKDQEIEGNKDQEVEENKDQEVEENKDQEIKKNKDQEIEGNKDQETKKQEDVEKEINENKQKEETKKDEK